MTLVSEMDTRQVKLVVTVLDLRKNVYLRIIKSKIIYIYKRRHDAPGRFAGFSVLDVGLAGV